MKQNPLFIGIITLLMLASCSTETAQPYKARELIIASDYLEAKDTLLFRAFAKKNAIRILIYTLTSDKIISTIRNKAANSGIDLVMLKSLYDVSKLNKREILHHIDLTVKKSQEAIHYSSWKYNYVGFGIDPYIIAFELNSDNKVKIYNDLTRFYHINKLESNHYPPMLAPILKKLNKARGNQWIKDCLDHSISKPIPGDSLLNDSLFLRLPVLTTLSDFKLNKDSNHLYKNKSFLLPNERSKGTFYNLRSIAIVNQASNYTIALDFIGFCLDEKNNVKLNDALNTYSIYSRQIDFRKYSPSAEELIPYYSIIEHFKIKLESN
ncbi:MAG: hypothetical protein QNK85_09360 [Crocinitomicaceae bacterium]